MLVRSARWDDGGMRTDLIGSQSHDDEVPQGSGSETTTAATGMPELDAMEPRDALQLVAGRMAALEALEVEQVWRARVAGLSWRSIAALLGVPPSTVRRWAERDPADAFTRHRGTVRGVRAT